MNWTPFSLFPLAQPPARSFAGNLGPAEQSFPVLPPGTLAANLVGGYIIGLAIDYFAQAPHLSPDWRLMMITGFCGGLTTFSTFSAEVVTRLQESRLVWAMTAIAIHVTGSLKMTFAGLATGRVLRYW